MGRTRLVSLLAILVGGDLLAAPPDVTIADFEGDDYGAWKVTGTAFGEKPARGTLPMQMHVTGFRGQGLVNSFVGGDAATGTLTSPKFRIERDYINFLIGGGKFPGKTCMNLILGDKVVRTATGPNDQPGGTEELAPACWDVKEFVGQDATLQIVDRQTGGWGHITVDHITMSQAKAAGLAIDRSRDIVLPKRYLLLPVANAAKAVRATVSVDGKLLHDFDMNLAADRPDWWAMLDLSHHVGKKATLTVKNVLETSKGLDMVEAADQPRHVQPLYDEVLRPQLRFSQMRGWNNDPNGMVYYDGEYHLFWQSNPFGPQWANMYWGHAVSKDLVHWQELPLALYPRTMAKNHCFSGSAHVDEHNTGGWQAGDAKTMVAVFTDTGAGEAIAVSNDRGRSWRYIPDNPVIPKHDGRDPKLIWHEPSKSWVIVLYTRENKRDFAAFYNSTDLKSWRRTGQIEGYFECPELFELPVDGDSNRKRWVLFAADAKYAVGAFDGKTFIPEHNGKRQVHYGSFYASQCFSRAPRGRVIQVGWARMEFPGMPFNQAFSLPIELRLKSTDDGVRLVAEPIRELEALRGPATAIASRTVTPDHSLVIDVPGQLLDILAEVDVGDAKEIKLQFGTNSIVYRVAERKLDDMPLTLTGNVLSFRVIVDRPMYEIVGGPGTVYKTAQRKDGGKQIESLQFSCIGGAAVVKTLKVHPMSSIWK